MSLTFWIVSKHGHFFGLSALLFLPLDAQDWPAPLPDSRIPAKNQRNAESDRLGECELEEGINASSTDKMGTVALFIPGTSITISQDALTNPTKYPMAKGVVFVKLSGAAVSPDSIQPGTRSAFD